MLYRKFQSFSLVGFIFLTLLFISNLQADGAGNLPVQNTESKDEVEQGISSPFTVAQISFFAPLQIFSEKNSIYGLRLSLPYGKNDTLVGVDLGIANKLNSLYGISFAALLSQRTNNMYGINLSGVFNISKGDDIGVSLAGFYNNVKDLKGLQCAVLYNQAVNVKGLQFGLVNYCHDMQGVQLGVINFCKTQPFPFVLFFNFWQ